MQEENEEKELLEQIQRQKAEKEEMLDDSQKAESEHEEYVANLSQVSVEETKDENDFIYKVYFDQKEITKTKMLQEVDTFSEILKQKGKVKQEMHKYQNVINIMDYIPQKKSIILQKMKTGMNNRVRDIVGLPADGEPLLQGESEGVEGEPAAQGGFMGALMKKLQVAGIKTEKSSG